MIYFHIDLKFFNKRSIFILRGSNATKQHERRKRGPIEVELKSNELIPSDPILNQITTCVGAVKVRVKVRTVLHFATVTS